jgi:hypothetical protein
MNCHARLLGLVLAIGLLSGCVERRFVITTDPPGAVVYCNGEYVGLAGGKDGGVDKFFTYYGKYRFTIVKDGYVTLTSEEMIATPWYEIPPLDFFTENVWPFKESDVRRLHFHLEKACPENASSVLDKSNVLRQQNDAIQSPLAPKPGTANGTVPIQIPPQPPAPVPPVLPGPPTPAPLGPPTPGVQPGPPIPTPPPAIFTSSPGNSAPR